MKNRSESVFIIYLSYSWHDLVNVWPHQQQPRWTQCLTDFMCVFLLFFLLLFYFVLYWNVDLVFFSSALSDRAFYDLSFFHLKKKECLLSFHLSSIGCSQKNTKKKLPHWCVNVRSEWTKFHAFYMWKVWQVNKALLFFHLYYCVHLLIVALPFFCECRAHSQPVCAVHEVYIV